MTRDCRERKFATANDTAAALDDQDDEDVQDVDKPRYVQNCQVC